MLGFTAVKQSMKPTGDGGFGMSRFQGCGNLGSRGHSRAGVAFGSKVVRW